MTHKTLSDGSVLYMINQQKAFIDHGEQILMESNKDNNEEAILAAILLAKEKYRGAFELTGTEEFKRRAIEVMVKHKLDVHLKNPQQHALRQEIAQTISENTEDTPLSTKTVTQNGISSKIDIIGKDKQNRTKISKNLGNSHLSSNNSQKVSNHTEGNVIQFGVDSYTHNEENKSNHFVTLEDANGKHSTICERDYPEILDITHPVQSANHELRESAAATSSHPSRTAASNINLKEIDMTATYAEQDAVLRGVRKLENGKFDTTVLLYKGKGDYLQGYIKIGERERQVVAHFNQRKPNPETGEPRPNYITLSEPHGYDQDTTWKEIGFGNAVNNRKDNKPVYFDEVLFSVDNHVIKARLTRNVDDDIHRKLGFQEPRKKRPKFETSNTQESNPKPVAPEANEYAVEAAGAQKNQPRRNASPMHA